MASKEYVKQVIYLHSLHPLSPDGLSVLPNFQQPKFLSAIIKNLNWQILTKNLVTFKRKEGVKDEKC